MTTNETRNPAVATEVAPNNPGPNKPGRAFSKRAMAIIAILQSRSNLGGVGLTSPLLGLDSPPWHGKLLLAGSFRALGGGWTP
jgi:hypothetical protein